MNSREDAPSLITPFFFVQNRFIGRILHNAKNLRYRIQPGGSNSFAPKSVAQCATM